MMNVHMYATHKHDAVERTAVLQYIQKIFYRKQIVLSSTEYFYFKFHSRQSFTFVNVFFYNDVRNP